MSKLKKDIHMSYDACDHEIRLKNSACFFQLWTYCIPIERTFFAKQGSRKRLCAIRHRF